MINRRQFVTTSAAAIAGSLAAPRLFANETADSSAAAPIAIDASRTAGAFPHFWEKCAGSDRTVVGLREQWRQDLIRCQRETGIQSVRCHGLFNDEMGVAPAPGHFNFLYVDQIYDFMLDHGVRPFVELSFMPEAFATSANHIFFYKGNVSPPRRWQDWHDLVEAFARHCVQRYGLGEVRNWNFEVWNEPNISFWAGSQQDYFELYRQSALALKGISPDLRVGGPSTAQLDWIPDLIHYCATNNVPIDFATTHVYPNDPQKRIFGKDRMYSYEQVIPRGVEHVKQQITDSKMPHLPLWITEWSSQNPAFIADTIKNCIGLAECMSYWTFSNVFEEGGVPPGLFNESFGMLDQWGIARPSFHSFVFLHNLGDTLIQTGPDPVLATRRSDGSLAILLWNLIPATEGGVANGNPMAATGGAGEIKGATKQFTLRFSGLNGLKQLSASQTNMQTGSAVPKWREMGSPQYPSAAQLADLRSAAELPQPAKHTLSGDTFSIELPPNGLALLEIA